MSLSERDDSIETFLFDRADEPLGIGVEVGTVRRQPNRLDAAARQDLAVDPGVEGIAVVTQMVRGPQHAIDRVGQIASHLLHPRAARLRVDPGDGHMAGLQLDHEKDDVTPETRQRNLGRFFAPYALFSSTRQCRGAHHSCGAQTEWHEGVPPLT